MSGGSEDVKDAEQIYHTCGGLPLAMAQVCRFITALNVPLREAKTRFSKPEVFVSVASELNRPQQPDYDHQIGVPFVWDEPLQSLNPSCAAMVHFLAYLDPDSIPEDFLRSCSKLNMQEG